MSIKASDLSAIEARLARARNPAKAAADDKAKREKAFDGLERELSRQFCAYLTQRGIPHFVCRTDKRSHATIGWVDVTAIWGGRVACVELKTATGTLSEAQRACHEALRATGTPVCVARSLQHAIEFVRLTLFPHELGTPFPPAQTQTRT